MYNTSVFFPQPLLSDEPPVTNARSIISLRSCFVYKIDIFYSHIFCNCSYYNVHFSEKDVFYHRPDADGGCWKESGEIIPVYITEHSLPSITSLSAAAEG